MKEPELATDSFARVNGPLIISQWILILKAKEPELATESFATVNGPPPHPHPQFSYSEFWPPWQKEHEFPRKILLCKWSLPPPSILIQWILTFMGKELYLCKWSPWFWCNDFFYLHGEGAKDGQLLQATGRVVTECEVLCWGREAKSARGRHSHTGLVLWNETADPLSTLALLSDNNNVHLSCAHQCLESKLRQQICFSHRPCC